MQLYINDEQIDFTLENEKTFQDIFNFIADDCYKNSCEIIGIIINGEPILADKLADYMDLDISKIETLAFNTVSEAQVKEAIVAIGETSDLIIPKLGEVPLQIQKNMDKDVAKTLELFTSLFSTFCKIVPLMSLFPEGIGKVTFNSMSAKDFLAEFFPVLQDLEEAIKNNDSVLIGDLAEYEIMPRFEAISKTSKEI